MQFILKLNSKSDQTLPYNLKISVYHKGGVYVYLGTLVIRGYIAQ